MCTRLSSLYFVSSSIYDPSFYPEYYKGQQYMGHWVCEGIFTLEGSSVVVWGLGRGRGGANLSAGCGSGFYQLGTAALQIIVHSISPYLG